jgi:hypothetical protein
MGSLIPGIQSTWNGLLAAAAALIAIVGTFLLPPPFYTDIPWVGAAKFGIAVIVGLNLVAAYRDHRPRGVRLQVWCKRTIVYLALGALSGFAYYGMEDFWTIPCFGHVTVVGATMIPDASEYARRHPEKGACEILGDSLGRVEKVWPMQQVVDRQLALGTTYVLAAIFLSSGIVSLTQALGIAQPPDPRRRKLEDSTS